jgi:hypothetical protein
VVPSVVVPVDLRLHSKSSWSVDIDGSQHGRLPSRNTRRCGKVAQEEHPRCPKQQSLRHILGCARLAGDKPSLEAGVRRAWLGTGDCQKERACRSADPWRGNDKSRWGHGASQAAKMRPGWQMRKVITTTMEHGHHAIQQIRYKALLHPVLLHVVMERVSWKWGYLVAPTAFSYPLLSPSARHC